MLSERAGDHGVLGVECVIVEPERLLCVEPLGDLAGDIAVVDVLAGSVEPVPCVPCADAPAS